MKKIILISYFLLTNLAYSQENQKIDDCKIKSSIMTSSITSSIKEKEIYDLNLELINNQEHMEMAKKELHANILKYNEKTNELNKWEEKNLKKENDLNKFENILANQDINQMIETENINKFKQQIIELP